MKRIVRLLFTVFATGGLGSGLCARAAEEPILLDGLAAWVNEHPVTVSEVLGASEPVRRKLQRDYEGAALHGKMDEVYRETLEDVINRYVVLDEYRKGEQKLPAWAVDQRADELVRQMFNDDRAELTKALEEDRMTYDEWRGKVEEQLVFSMMRGNSVEQHVRVSPEAVKRYYEANRDELAVPLEIRAAMVVIPVAEAGDARAAWEQAERIRAGVISGGDMAKVGDGKEDSAPVGRYQDSGWVDPKMLRGEILRAIERLKPGELAPVVDGGSAVYVVRLDGRRGGEPLSFAEAQPRIERELSRKQAEVLYKAWIGRLRAEAYVKVVRGTLE